MHFSSAFRCFLATKKKYYQQSRWRRVIQNIFVQKKVSNVTFQARTTHTHSHKYCKETPQQHTQINWVEIDNDRNRKYKNIFIFFQWMSTFSFFGILCHDSFYSTLYCHWFGNITVNTHTHTIHTHFIDDVDPISNTPANRQQQRKYIYISHIRICNNICCFFFLFFIRMKFTIFRLNNSERNKKKTNKMNRECGCISSSVWKLIASVVAIIVIALHAMWTHGRNDTATVATSAAGGNITMCLRQAISCQYDPQRLYVCPRLHWLQ